MNTVKPPTSRDMKINNPSNSPIKIGIHEPQTERTDTINIHLLNVLTAE